MSSILLLEYNLLLADLDCKPCKKKVGFLVAVTAAPLLLYRLKMMADSTLTDIISNFLSLYRCWHDWLWHRLLGLEKVYIDHGYTSLEAKLIRLKVSVSWDILYSNQVLFTAASGRNAQRGHHHFLERIEIL
ncbi:hypothetical protein PoB_003204000 [Plakobranchus ocellatus]|uniref:Uncharacterized protein n=1 Tax=Plakobranchus ocellatus TaxID=259542 RepID=A0AAV4AFJ6_9GAST|nr:hypothetical protein PoB_003204000 [Plakobranchus ocellatus]